MCVERRTLAPLQIKAIAVEGGGYRPEPGPQSGCDHLAEADASDQALSDFAFVIDRRYLSTTARRIASSISSSVARHGGLPSTPNKRRTLGKPAVMITRLLDSKVNRSVPPARTSRWSQISFGIVSRPLPVTVASNEAGADFATRRLRVVIAQVASSAFFTKPSRYTSRLRSTAAPTNEANSGCG
jgi:hypothetical protein